MKWNRHDISNFENEICMNFAILTNDKHMCVIEFSNNRENRNLHFKWRDEHKKNLNDNRIVVDDKYILHKVSTR